MNEVAWVNGEFMPLEAARVSINDRAFLFGDGVYEVVVGYGQRLWAFERHWVRLARSLRELDIEGVDLSALANRVRDAVALAEAENPLVYVQISRGVAPRAHAWDPETLLPSIVVTVREASFAAAVEHERGVGCITQPDLRWGRCDIKSLNLLANVMAKQQAQKQGAFEAILVAADGTVTEGSSTSVCAVADGTIRVPPEGPRILPGVTRRLALELAEDLGIPVREEAFDLSTLRSADELFLTGTTTEVLAVTRLDGRAVGRGRVGPITRRLEEAYRRAVAACADAPRC